MEDFSYALPVGAQADPIAAPDMRGSLLILANRIDRDELEPVAQAAGLRLLGVTPLADAAARLDAQSQCDILLFFLPTPTVMLEQLLVQVETQAIQTGMSVILVAGWDTVDLAFACLRNPLTQLLCDPDRTELAAALITAAERRPTLDQVHEMERESAHLRQLSEEVGRLARTIDALSQRARMPGAPSFELGARMSDRPGDYIGMPSLAPIGAPACVPDRAVPMVSATQVRDLLRARRLRADFLPGDLFADPAWDMLLDLFAAQLEQERVSVSSLCIAAAVPPTTALRWIRTLSDKGLVERQADPQDGRRIFISLAQEAAQALTRWFGASRRYMHA